MQVKEVEDVLETEDRERIIHSVYSSAEQTPKPKKALRNAVIELYAKREVVALSPQSTDRLEQILTRLQELLAEQGM